MESWNKVIPNAITKVGPTLVPEGFVGDVESTRAVQHAIATVVNQLGLESASAQGLNKVITTVQKMRCSQNCVLYLLNDSTANGGKGDIVGLLKVGYKHLYLDDHTGTGRMVEVEPLCVLDFYVQQNRQRHGLGKLLFNYMLKDTGLPPHHLAVDGPSKAMLQFLGKTYGMHNMVRHANNFSVAPAFLQEIDKISKPGCTTPASSTSGAGRFSAPRPESGIGQIIHGSASDDLASRSMTPEEAATGPSEEVVEERPRSEAPAPAPSPSPVETEAGDSTPPAGEPSVQRPCTLLVDSAAAAETARATPSPAGSTVSRRDSQLTDKGFFDVKFYHNKLW